MSEDDIDLASQDGPGSARVDRDRRAPRFSWTSAYETTFFRSLCESVQLGLRENSSFKAEAWERAAQALQDSHGAYPAKSHLINKSDNARKRFRLWRGLREDPDFMYNSITKTVTATEEAWRAHIEREPLSRALRGRPFDHEEFMEILYPDVIGSGGAPKRIMKPRRRTDGQLCDEAEMPGTGVLNLQSDPTPPAQAVTDSPGQQKNPCPTPTGSSSGNPPLQRPTSTTLPPRNPNSGQATALTPPEESVSQSRKRPLPLPSLQNNSEPTQPPASSTPLAQPIQSSGSPEKRRRTSSQGETVPSLVATTTLSSSVLTTPAAASNPISWPQPDAQTGGNQSVIEEIVDVLRARGSRLWREEAVELFFRDFGEEDPDLQIRISESILSNEHKAMVFCKMPFRLRQHWVRSLSVSYADAAAKGPKQSPEEAAAPQPPEIIPNESASTASLIDVDLPSVHTVNSDFLDQDIQTETQADRREREEEAENREAAEAARKKAAAKANKVDSWLTQQFSQLSDGSAGAIAIANLAGLVGVSGFLGYRAWGLYQRSRLDVKHVGIGVGILAAVGAVEAVVGRYLYKGKKDKSS